MFLAWLRKVLPTSIKDILRPLFLRISAIYLPLKYKKEYSHHLAQEDRLRNIDIYTVAFFAIHASVWKYDYLYRLMEKHPKFNPIIVICPVVNFGFDNMLQVMEKCYERFSSDYNCIKAYDKESHSYIDVRESINPDIIFYTNPYKGLIDDRYYIDKFRDKLTCYVSYNFGNSCLYTMFHNLELHNLVWRLYAETEKHKQYSQIYAYNKGINVKVTGYPGIDKFIDKSHKPKDTWKIKDLSLKRIIWAPHHTFSEDEVVYYSCFLQYHQFMLDLASKYEGKIQLAFKPHPLLRVKLNKYWGKDRTDRYYDAWANLSNGVLEESDYVDLFLTSDAMIHDCGSFITEYLYTLKPVMRTDNEIDPSNEFNDFALECLSLHYHAKSTNDIELFVTNLIDGIDPLKEQRISFYKKNLLPPNGQLASQNIMDDILNSLK